MPRGRSQMPYYGQCPETDVHHLQRGPCFADNYGKLDGPCGLGVSEFKSPMMSHADPPPPPPKKKRRSSNTVSVAANSQPSSSPMMQDLLPPPPIGYGDTIVASNPFDDAPPLTPSMSHMNPMNQVNKSMPVTPCMSPSASMMGSISPCHIVGSPINCGPNVGSPRSPMNPGPNSVGSPLLCNSSVGSPLLCNSSVRGPSPINSGPLNNSINLNYNPNTSGINIGKSDLNMNELTLSRDGCGPGIINIKSNTNMPPVSCNMQINNVYSRQSDSINCNMGMNNSHCNPLMNNAQCNSNMNNLPCIGNGINRQQCGNMMNMGNISYDGLTHCRPNMSRSQFPRVLPNVHYSNNANSHLMCGPPDMGNSLCGPNNNMNNLHCIRDNMMNMSQCISSNNVNTTCSDPNSIFNSHCSSFDMNSRCSPNLHFNTSDITTNSSFYRQNSNNNCVPNVHNTVCPISKNSDILTNINDNNVNTNNTKINGDCNSDICNNPLSNVVGLCGVESGTNDLVNDNINLITCQNKNFERINDNEDRKPNIKDINTSIINNDENDVKFPETNSDENGKNISIKNVCNDELKHHVKCEPNIESDNSNLNKIVATSNSTDNLSTAVTTTNTTTAVTSTSIAICGDTTSGNISTSDTLSKTSISMVGASDSNNNGNNNDKNNSNDDTDFNMYRSNCTINNNDNSNNNNNILKENNNEDIDKNTLEISAVKDETPEKNLSNVNVSNDSKNINASEWNNNNSINNSSCNDNENGENELLRKKSLNPTSVEVKINLNPTSVEVKIENDNFMSNNNGNKNDIVKENENFNNGNIVPNTTNFNVSTTSDSSNPLNNNLNYMSESICGSPVLPNMSRSVGLNAINNSVGFPGVKSMSVFSGKVYPSNKSKVFNPQNPNAPPIYACGVCHKEVNENDQAILCESGCNFWFHIVCCGLSEAAHQYLTEEVYAEWVCDNCLKTKNVPLVKFKP